MWHETRDMLQKMDAALVAAVSLSQRYIAGRFLLYKAIVLLDEACSTLYQRRTRKGERCTRVEDAA